MGKISLFVPKYQLPLFFPKGHYQLFYFSFESQDSFSEGGTRLLRELLNFCVLICLHIFSINRNSTQSTKTLTKQFPFRALKASRKGQILCWKSHWCLIRLNIQTGVSDSVIWRIEKGEICGIHGRACIKHEVGTAGYFTCNLLLLKRHLEKSRMKRV